MLFSLPYQIPPKNLYNKKTIIFVLGVQRKGSYPLSGLNILCLILHNLVSLTFIRSSDYIFILKGCSPQDSLEPLSR
nr:MAG TPA: hypothetical protein [Caudoviricetes sp.]DAN05223.1 MAG TPA: hypothetical protein [Caudoviricetes sp.]